MVNKVSLATIAATSIGLTPVAEVDDHKSPFCTVEQPEDQSSPPLRNPVPLLDDPENVHCQTSSHQWEHKSEHAVALPLQCPRSQYDACFLA